MSVGMSMRGLLPAAAITVGAGVAGGAIAYGSKRIAGESNGGTGMAMLGQIGGNPFVAGVAGGMLTSAFGSRLKLGALLPLLGIGAGIGGAMLGSRLAKSSLERAHPEEYAAQNQLVVDTMAATREAYAAAGASDAVLGAVDSTYDRSYFNASYHPRKDEITVGRSAETGMPLSTNDVVAHEYSHRVLHQYAPQLLSAFNSGHGRAIHESIADTFAMVVDDDDWTIAEDAIPGGMRSFSHPEIRGSFRGGEEHPAPITRDELERSTEEHSAAGVGNKAAWRIGDALGRDAMAKIYVAALERRELGSGATYDDLARVVRAASVDLYGAGSREATVVDEAWDAAGY